MSKECDHKSVGILVWQNDKILLIKRKKPPFGFAPPAGHVDDDISFENAAKRELQEEVGLTTKSIELLIEGRKDNPCRRNGGNWHYWKIYKAVTSGEIKRSEEETKQAKFVNKDLLLKLVEKTERYIRKEISNGEWERMPGLELVWHNWLKELKII